MKYSTLKRLSITMCSLIMVLCSKVQSAQDLTEPGTIALNKTKLFYQNGDTQLSDKGLIAPENIKLEESSASWASYLFAPFKSAVNNTYKIINYVKQNPQKAMLAGLILATNITAVAAGCDCSCYSYDVHARKKNIEYVGSATDLQMCSDICKQNSLTLARCR